jgi:hypothetical protein
MNNVIVKDNTGRMVDEVNIQFYEDFLTLFEIVSS